MMRYLSGSSGQDNLLVVIKRELCDGQTDFIETVAWAAWHHGNMGNVIYYTPSFVCTF